MYFLLHWGFVLIFFSMARVPAECKLERYFAEYEFSTRYLLCCSDVEALTMQELLDMADPEMKDMWSNLKLSYTESTGEK